MATTFKEYSKGWNEDRQKDFANVGLHVMRMKFNGRHLTRVIKEKSAHWKNLREIWPVWKACWVFWKGREIWARKYTMKRKCRGRDGSNKWPDVGQMLLFALKASPPASWECSWSSGFGDECWRRVTLEGAQRSTSYIRWCQCHVIDLSSNRLHVTVLIGGCVNWTITQLIESRVQQFAISELPSRFMEPPGTTAGDSCSSCSHIWRTDTFWTWRTLRSPTDFCWAGSCGIESDRCLVWSDSMRDIPATLKKHFQQNIPCSLYLYTYACFEVRSQSQVSWFCNLWGHSSP